MRLSRKHILDHAGGFFACKCCRCSTCFLVENVGALLCLLVENVGALCV